MKKKIAMEWAEALESGLYKQGTGQLRKGDKFCCLAVLCNLHAIKHPEIASKETYEDEYLKSGNFCPELVMNWSGLKDEEGYCETLQTSLTELNDCNKWSFNSIAEVIRKHWKEL